ncbi:MAG: DUF58 domain-containing protein [Firmicutes bacterium]|nr:DUF58 domain-containing protein [Bacillota bacterium]
MRERIRRIAGRLKRRQTANRVVFAGWTFVLLALFFWRGYPAVTAALLFTLAYAAAAFVFVLAGGTDLRISLSGGDMIEKGGTMGIRVRIENRGRLPVFLCCGRVSALNRLTGESRQLPLRLSAGPGGSAEQVFDLTDEYCGRIDTRIRELSIRDPLELFSAKRNSAGRTTGYIAPQISMAGIPDSWLDSYNMESYQYSQYEKGSDPGEVFGVREYQEGDSLKQIHWKLSAKLGNVTVKIPSFPVENNILIILDNLLEPDTDLTPAQKSRLMEEFYSLSAALLEREIPHSLGWFDGEDQAFLLRRVRSTEEMWATVPEALGCGFSPSQVSTVYRYLESWDAGRFSNHFLVTGQEGRDTERLESRGAVKVFRTTE